MPNVQPLRLPDRTAQERNRIGTFLFRHERMQKILFQLARRVWRSSRLALTKQQQRTLRVISKHPTTELSKEIQLTYRQTRNHHCYLFAIYPTTKCVQVFLVIDAIKDRRYLTEGLYIMCFLLPRSYSLVWNAAVFRQG